MSFAHIARILNGNRIFFTSTHYLCSNVQDTVGIQAESNLNLRHAAMEPVRYRLDKAT